MAVPQFFKELKRRNVYKVGTVYVISSWLIIQVITAIEEPLALPGWFDTAIIVLIGICFPIALIFAWAFELTPDGLQRFSIASKSQTDTVSSGKQLNTWIIGLLAIALVFMGLERVFFAESTFLSTQEEVSQKASIAVLPFEDFSAENDQEYFADGISEELLNVLAKVEGMQVAGRTSSFQFKGKNLDLKEVGEKLGVNHVLEGSVRKAGDMIRITAQLIRTDNGFHVWSETYDREYTAENIFGIQDEISSRVLQMLKVKLLPEEQRKMAAPLPTQNVEAYNVYLKGLSISASWNPDDLLNAIAFYNQAIKLDPGFAMANAKKAIAYYYLTRYGNMSPKESAEEGTDAAEWALLIDSELAEGYLAAGLMYDMNGEEEKGKIALSKALRLKPNDPEIIIYHTIFTTPREDVEEFRAGLFRAYDLDPLSALTNMYKGIAHEIKDDKEGYEKAERHFRKAIELQPDFLEAYRELSALIGDHQLRYGEAIIIMHQASQKVGKQSTVFRELIEYGMNLRMGEFAKQYLQQLVERFPKNMWAFRIHLEYMLYSSQYENAITLVRQYDQNVEKIPNLIYLDYLRDPMILTGREQEFLNLVRNRYPVAFRTDTVNLEYPNISIVEGVALALQRTGKKEKADILLRNYLPAMGNKLVAGFDNMRDHFHYAILNGLLGQKEKVLDFLRAKVETILLFNNWETYGYINELYYQLTPSEIKPFLEKEMQEIERQRKKVKDYLLQRGEWKEEWNWEV